MNLGAQKLARAPGTQEEKASRLGVKQQTVSRWLTEDVVPLGPQLIRAKQVYGIELNDWLAPAEPDSEAPPDAERASHG